MLCADRCRGFECGLLADRLVDFEVLQRSCPVLFHIVFQERKIYVKTIDGIECDSLQWVKGRIEELSLERRRLDHPRNSVGTR